MGRYRFHYHEKRHWLLSAESLEDGSRAIDADQLNQSLARANRFRFGALTDNQRGRLSLSQRLEFFFRYVALALSCLICVYLLLVYVYPDWGQLSGPWEKAWPLVAVAALGTSLSLLTRLRQLVEHVWGKVATTEGVVDKSESESLTGSGGTTLTYHYEMGARVWSVSKAGYEALVEGLRYRAYFLPGSKRLVNIELGDQEASEVSRPIPASPVAFESLRTRMGCLLAVVGAGLCGCAMVVGIAGAALMRNNPLTLPLTSEGIVLDQTLLPKVVAAVFTAGILLAALGGLVVPAPRKPEA
jgi:hypothetical protein